MATKTSSRPRLRSTSSRVDEPPELEDFAGFCGELTLDTRRPFVLEPFQRTILTDFFGGTAQTLVLLPKKNGKSTLVAALALYHLLTTENAEGYIAASSREQAGIILKQARKFIRSAPALGRHFEMNQRAIVNLNDEGFIKVLASDVDTADGVIPTFAVVDEMHRAKSAELYGIFSDGLGPRAGKMITITTAGDDSESPLGVMRSRAYAYPTVLVDGTHRYARSADGSSVMHEWALEPDQDREDMGVVKTANPASWQTLEELGKRKNSMGMTPWRWARFACGVWLQGEDTAIGPVEWAACGTDEAPPVGLTWRVGVDIGTKEDTTAIVAHAIDEDGVAWIGGVTVLVPPAERGVGLRKRVILDAIKEAAEQFGAQTVVIDPETGGEFIAEDLEDELGLELIAHSQKPMPMAQAAERFYAAVREEKIRHRRDATLTRHVLNAHRRSTVDGRWSFVKETKQSKKHIDALIAAAIVHNVAMDEDITSGPLIAWAG